MTPLSFTLTGAHGREMPTVEYLRSVLDYNPLTGVLTWRERPSWHFKISKYGNSWKTWNTAWSGKEAGHVCKKGKTYYRLVGLDGRIYGAHILCYALFHGEFAAFAIDHIDGVGTNNFASNLRLSVGPVNNRNAQMNSTNTSGFNGVCFNKRRGKWLAYMEIDNKRRWLGSFSTKEAAGAARATAQEGHGFTERHGKPSIGASL